LIFLESQHAAQMAFEPSFVARSAATG